MVVRRVNSLRQSAEELARCIRPVGGKDKKAPFVVRGGLPRFGKVTKSGERTWRWNQEELLKRLRESGREKEITSVLSPKPEGVNYVSQWKSKATKLSVRQALEMFGGRHKIQCRLDPALFWREHEDLPDIALDSRFHIVFDNSFVWLTSSGLRTSLHSDEDDGLLFHLHGEKRAILVPPESSDKDKSLLKKLLELRWVSGNLEDLYLNPSGESADVVSSLDLRFVDLKPGDVLYIPQRWLHDIESVTETVSIAVRFNFV